MLVEQFYAEVVAGCDPRVRHKLYECLKTMGGLDERWCQQDAARVWHCMQYDKKRVCGAIQCVYVKDLCGVMALSLQHITIEYEIFSRVWGFLQLHGLDTRQALSVGEV